MAFFFKYTSYCTLVSLFECIGNISLYVAVHIFCYFCVLYIQTETIERELSSLTASSFYIFCNCWLVDTIIRERRIFLKVSFSYVIEYAGQLVRQQNREIESSRE